MHNGKRAGNGERLFFTGASGALAPFLIHRFLHEKPRGGARAPRFVCLVRRPDASERIQKRIAAICPACAGAVASGRFEFVAGDVSAGFAYDGPVDAVWHFASDLRMDPESAEQVAANNLAGTRRILEFCEKKRAPLYYLSTAYVCGTRTGPVREDELLCGQRFRNAYESSKADSEALVQAWLRDHPAIVFRPSIVLGDTATGVVLSFNGLYKLMNWARYFQESLIPRLGLSAKELAAMTLRPPLSLSTSPSRTYINVVGAEYITALMARIHRAPEALGKTFHLVNPEPPTVAGLLRQCSRVLGIKAIELPEPGEAPPEELGAEVRQINRWLGHQIMVYWPYLVGGHADFDMAGVRKVCGGTPKHPALDAAAWDRMYRYAVAQDFVPI